MRLYNNSEELERLTEVYPYIYLVDRHGKRFKIFSDEDISLEEATAYLDREYGFFKDYLVEIALHFDGNYVDISRGTDPMPDFDRIRRITGYLVGTLDRFNDGKRAEEAERVKHSLGD